LKFWKNYDIIYIEKVRKELIEMEENKTQWVYLVEDARANKYFCVKTHAEAYALAVKIYADYISSDDETWTPQIIKSDLTDLFDLDLMDEIVYITKIEVVDMEDID
jgi:hypothetical protein